MSASAASPETLAAQLLARHPRPILHLVGSQEIRYANPAARQLLEELVSERGRFRPRAAVLVR